MDRLNATNTMSEICWAEAFLPTIWTERDTPSSLGRERPSARFRLVFDDRYDIEPATG